VVVLCNTPTDLTTSLGEKIIQSLAGMQVEPPTFHKAIEFDAATLEKYVGVYELAPTFAITVTLEDGQLMAQATAQDKYPIYAESETEFFYKVVDAQLTFEVGDDGTTKQLVLHQNGGHLPGVRVDSDGGE
jgi:D-alanyl-D-alanine-carboxypeptidase/D-alanyl-D-alanine-endopeptidase